ncbi:repeat, TIGR02543 family, partial [Fusobacterium sp. CM21]
GWYTSATGGVNVASYSKVEIESDIYLYARWEKKKYKVEFNDNYTSTVFPQDKTVSEGEEFGVLPEPQREGYKFLGWFAYTDTYKEYQVNYATKFYSSYSYQTTVSLFAKWERAQYIITFEPAGGVVEGVGGVNIKNVSYGLLYGSLPTPVRDGYEFQGWFTAAEGGEEVNSYTLVPALTSYYQTLYAHWEKIKVEEYRVTFNPDGGHLNKEEKNKTIVFGRE